MFALFTGFIDQPWLAAAPALGFLGLWMLTRLRSALTAAVLWGLYGAWEYAIWAGHACSGDCNIRVDLLLIVPGLLVATAIALIMAVRWGRRG